MKKQKKSIQNNFKNSYRLIYRTHLDCFRHGGQVILRNDWRICPCYRKRFRISSFIFF